MGYRVFTLVLVRAFMLLGAMFTVATASSVQTQTEVNTYGLGYLNGKEKNVDTDKFCDIGGITTQVEKADFREKVVASVKWQMDNYPESRLIDLYKNFYQDKFGPGHMISDTASAGAYLRRELATVSGKAQKEYIETTGWEGNFVRVDLSLLKDGVLDYNTFFTAFIKSISQTKAPSVSEWKREWKEIEEIIRQLYPNIPGLKEDSKVLDDLLSKGNFVVHHSEAYNKKYNPHYRLISKKFL